MKQATTTNTKKQPTMKTLEIKTTQEHYTKYAAILLDGREYAIECVPVTKEKILDALNKGDIHLNTIPLTTWDMAVLCNHAVKKGLTLAEGVCLLKHCAIYHIAKCIPVFE